MVLSARAVFFEKKKSEGEKSGPSCKGWGRGRIISSLGGNSYAGHVRGKLRRTGGSGLVPFPPQCWAERETGGSALYGVGLD